MKRRALFFLAVALLFAVMGCSLSDIAGGPTATPTPLPTSTPTSTATITLTPTHKPTNTPTETSVPKVTLAQMEKALRGAGYKPSNYGSVTIWVLDNVFETTATYASGQLEMGVLNSLKSRLDHMEKKFKVMDGLFPDDFMAKLREANLAYADTVGAGVTGDPTDLYGPQPGDLLKYTSATYNISDQKINGYDVRFSLFFEQWTCPAEYICTFPAFGNQQFQGQASFVFYEVAVLLDA
jgi:hypothetical protein